MRKIATWSKDGRKKKDVEKKRYSLLFRYVGLIHPSLLGWANEKKIE